MNLQDVANLTIPEGEVKMIHDKNKKLLWGRLSYDTTYRGDTFQQTYSGKNLFDGIIEQGGFTGGGLNNSNTHRLRSKNYIDVLPNTSYTIKTFSWDTEKGSTCSVGISYYDVNDYTTARIGESGWKDGGNGATFTTPTGCHYVRFLISIGSGTPGSANITPDDVSNIQLESGSQPTAYEPYVGGIPAPNPDYPQAIQTVTGEQNVWVHGKNLADPQTFIDWIDTTYDLCVQYSWGDEDSRPKYGAYQNRNHVARFSGSTLYSVRNSMTNPTYDEAKIIYQNMGFKENTRYTVSFDVYSTGSSGATNLQFLYTDGTTNNLYGASQNTWVHCEVKSQSGKTISCIRIIYLTGTVYLDLDTLQIEEGNATTYEPYQGANYTVNLGSTELCKIGDYQDYIYKSGDDWYVHKETGKVTYNGSENWKLSNHSRCAITKPSGWDTWGADTSTYASKGYSTHLLPGDTGTFDNSFNVGGTNVFVRASGKGTGGTSIDAWKTWLSSHNITLYSILATPTNTQITDATLIGQLDAIHQFLTRYGYNFSVDGDLPIIINQGGLT